MVAWESLLERDAILLLEFSPGVVSYQEQPTVVHYADGQQLREYYPDFELILDCGSVVHLEIKPAQRLANPKVASKFRAVASHYLSRHREFRILTEQEIHREPRFSNLRSLAYLAGRPCRELPTPAALLRNVSEPLTFRSVAALLGRDTTMRLIASGQLVCDLDKALADDTLVTIPAGGDHATLLF